MTCRIFHRWSKWTTEYEELPGGWMGVYRVRTRECRRKRCDYFEEVIRCVSSSPEVVRGPTR
jgi:hypothetical protein